MSIIRMLAPIARIGSMTFRQSPSKEPVVTSIKRAYCSANTPLIFEISEYDEFIEQVVEQSKTAAVLVDCYADWCGPCKNLTPRLEEKIRNRGGDFLLAKINVDHAGELAMDLDITAVPTVFAFKNGQSVGQFQGDRADEQLDDFMERVLNNEYPVYV